MKSYYTRLCPHSQGYNSTVCIGCGSDLFFCPRCFPTEPDLCEDCEREAADQFKIQNEKLKNSRKEAA